MKSNNLFLLLESALAEKELHQKLQKVKDIYKLYNINALSFDKLHKIEKFDEIGRPNKPELVSPKLLKPRKFHTQEGIATFIHAIAHIEFNAINLACDAAYRFQDMPEEYIKDWLQVAIEEVKHFELLNNYLKELGYCYGDFAAHNQLWSLACETRDDVLIRMGIVPRVMEARGLDVTPAIIKKFEQIKNQRVVEILTIILEEEIGHVQIGNRWYHYLCKQRNKEPIDTFKELIKKYLKTSYLKAPFSYEYRKQAGFSDQEIKFLEHLAS
tara:strand:- start:1475 stop:2284 length:810 start_codon:yes stop_codon:yes gene_type:complete